MPLLNPVNMTINYLYTAPQPHKAACMTGAEHDAAVVRAAVLRLRRGLRVATGIAGHAFHRERVDVQVECGVEEPRQGCSVGREDTLRFAVSEEAAEVVLASRGRFRAFSAR